ncbi:hypothetical protein HYU09_00150 [Candidatus Woesearchaeota archaeon]|nr:hypothetical protein [Candidatus Woesearchaeota archaeon]
MATQFREIINFFDNIGIFDVVLPFLLVFTIVFALLERTKVFGVEEIDGKKYTKKNLNSVAAFVIAFLVIASSRLVEIITAVSSNFVVLLFLVVLFLLLVGSFFQERPEGVFLEGGWKTAFMVIVFIVLIFIFLDALNLLDDTFGFLSGSSRGEVTGSIFLLIIIVMFVVYVTQDSHRHHDKKS